MGRMLQQPTQAHPETMGGIVTEDPFVKIPLPHGLFALVSQEDYCKVAEFRWYAYKKPRERTWYAKTNMAIVNDGSGRRQRKVLMHRLILDAPTGVDVDHQDGNGLNNTRQNIRLATAQQNARNRRYNPGENACGFKGVKRDPKSRTKPWMARIYHAGIRIYLGYYRSAREAALAYDHQARELFGDFAALNFPDTGPVDDHAR